MSKKLKWWRNKKVIHIPLDTETHKKICELAEQHDLPVTTTARKLIKFFLNEIENPQKSDLSDLADVKMNKENDKD